MRPSDQCINRVEFIDCIDSDHSRVEKLFLGYGAISLERMLNRLEYIRSPFDIIEVCTMSEIDFTGHIEFSNDEHSFDVYMNSGLLHREDGPALIWSSKSRGYFEEWRINGCRHREDGPAARFPAFDQWYTNGVFCHINERYTRVTYAVIITPDARVLRSVCNGAYLAPHAPSSLSYVRKNDVDMAHAVMTRGSLHPYPVRFLDRPALLEQDMAVEKAKATLV
jgi:hypothetical protein